MLQLSRLLRASTSHHSFQFASGKQLGERPPGYVKTQIIQRNDIVYWVPLLGVYIGKLLYVFTWKEF